MKKTGLFHNIIGIALLAMIVWSCGADKALRKAEQSEALGEYFEAAKHYKKAYSKTSAKQRDKRGERAFKMAECYRRINYAARAAGAYRNAVRYKYPDSMAIRHLADMQRMTGAYKEAAKNYELYLQQAPADGVARNGLKACEMAQQWKKNESFSSEVKKKARMHTLHYSSTKH